MDTIFPSPGAAVRGEAVPNHLGGYQNVVYGKVYAGDLLVWTDGFTLRRVARFANPIEDIGDEIDNNTGFLRREDGYFPNTAVYRKISVINQANACMTAISEAHNETDLVRCTGAIKDVSPGAIIPNGHVVTIPTDAAARKALPVATGVLDYFPDAILAVAACSKAGNDQHNPGKPLHWDRSKSGDEADALVRHLLSRGTVDTDGIRHSAKVAWRALALLQKELEQSQHATPATACVTR